MTIRGYTLFCDDIRNELGGKKSFMGVYSQLIAAEGFPLLLPKFAFGITIIFEKDDDPPSQFLLRIYLPGDEEGKPSISGEIVTEVDGIPPIKRLPDDVRAMRDKLPMLAARVDFMVSPLQLIQSGPIKVEAVFGDDVVPAGWIAVVQRPHEGVEPTPTVSNVVRPPS